MSEELPRVGLALGGGGARGWAHIGAIRALEGVGIRPSVVAGTSMGAAVGAAYAAGKLEAFETWARALDRRTVLGLFDFSFRGGLIGASRVFEELAEILPEGDIEDLPLAFGATATDLERGSERWLTDGPIRDALRASIAIPGLIRPKQIGNRWYVDGGLLDPVPVALARALGAEVVIAVELSSHERSAFRLDPLLEAAKREALAEDAEDAENEALEDVEGEATSTEEGAPKDLAMPPAKPTRRPDRDFFEALSDLSERFWTSVWPAAPTPAAPPCPSVYEVIGKSLEIMQSRITRSLLAGDPPDLHVVPRLHTIGLMDFERAEEAIAEGQRAVRLALAAQQDFHIEA